MYLNHSEHHNTMRNYTTRLAVKIQHLSPYDFDWSNNLPQRSRESLQEENILADEEDGVVLHKRMVQFMMQFLVTEFSDLQNLSQFSPSLSGPHTVEKSVVVPMKMLFCDEKYTDENILILHQFIEDAALSGHPQVIFSIDFYGILAIICRILI